MSGALSEPEMYGRSRSQDESKSNSSDSPLTTTSDDDEDPTPLFILQPALQRRQAPSHYEHASVQAISKESKTLNKAKANYNMDISNPNLNKEYNEQIGIVMIRTTKADEMTIFHCLNIYYGLYLMSLYHLLINIPYFYMAWIMFYDHFEYETGELIINETEIVIMCLTITFGLIRILTFGLGISIIPKIQNEKLSELEVKKCNKYLTKLWLSLLLIAPILCDLALVLGYIQDVIGDEEYDHDEDTVTDKLNDTVTENKSLIMMGNDVVIMFMVVFCELILSIYFFFVTNSFMAMKWPNLRQS